jgi:hypothetical protein
MENICTHTHTQFTWPNTSWLLNCKQYFENIREKERQTTQNIKTEMKQKNQEINRDSQDLLMRTRYGPSALIFRCVSTLRNLSCHFLTAQALTSCVALVLANIVARSMYYSGHSHNCVGKFATYFPTLKCRDDKVSPWRRRRRVHLEKLIVSQLVNKFPALHETRMVITVFASSRYWNIWVRLVQSTFSHPIFKIHFNIIIPSTSISTNRSSGITFYNYSLWICLFRSTFIGATLCTFLQSTVTWSDDKIHKTLRHNSKLDEWHRVMFKMFYSFTPAECHGIC